MTSSWSKQQETGNVVTARNVLGLSTFSKGFSKTRLFSKVESWSSFKRAPKRMASVCEVAHRLTRKMGDLTEKERLHAFDTLRSSLQGVPHSTESLNTQLAKSTARSAADQALSASGFRAEPSDEVKFFFKGGCLRLSSLNILNRTISGRLHLFKPRKYIGIIVLFETNGWSYHTGTASEDTGAINEDMCFKIK